MFDRQCAFCRFFKVFIIRNTWGWNCLFMSLVDRDLFLFVSVGLCMISVSWLCKLEDICPPKFIFSNALLWVERGDQHHANKSWEHQKKVRHGTTNKTHCCFCCVKLTRVLSGTLLGNANRASIILCYYFLLYLQPQIQP